MNNSNQFVSCVFSPPLSLFNYDPCMLEIARKYGHMQLHVAECKIAPSSSSGLIKVVYLLNCQSFDQSTKPSDQCLQRCSHCLPSISQDHNYQCLHRRLGNLSGDIESSGFVDRSGSFSSYQNPGASSHLQCVPGLSGTDQESQSHNKAF